MKIRRLGVLFVITLNLLFSTGCQKATDNDFIVKYKAPNTYYSADPMWGAHYQMNTSNYPGNDWYNQNF